ncbi:hypothetical protein [Janibacter sp. GS2]|uniref:hypothetical protein n=1 Tax=Janibacter sp. GS2 TaxID=3442646 RepID=UPI003EB78029
MTARTRRLAPFAAVLSLGLLAACGSGEDSASTSPPEPESSTVTVTETAAPERTDGPAQQELTTKQIAAALPTLKDAPKGFVKDDRIESGEASTRQTDPDRCRAVYLDTDEIRAWKEEHLTAIDGVRYSEPGDRAGRPSASTFIATYDEPFPKEYFDEAGSMLGKCATFEEKGSASGTWIDKRTSNIVAPVVGDQSYAHRSGVFDLDLTIDQLWVRSGHNVINIRVLTSYSRYSDETMSDLADSVLEDLEG